MQLINSIKYLIAIFILSFCMIFLLDIESYGAGKLMATGDLNFENVKMGVNYKLQEILGKKYEVINDIKDFLSVELAFLACCIALADCSLISSDEL